jgi:NDP-sugar pyrophosphorylase family protein
VVANEGKLYSMPLKTNFWYDIGQPGDYLLGQAAFLTHYHHGTPDRPNSLIDKTVVIE